MMMAFERELKVFEMELRRNSDKIFDGNRNRQKYVNKVRSQAQNGNSFSNTEYYLDLNSRPESQRNGMGMQSVG